MFATAHDSNMTGRLLINTVEHLFDINNNIEYCTVVAIAGSRTYTSCIRRNSLINTNSNFATLRRFFQNPNVRVSTFAIICFDNYSVVPKIHKDGNMVVMGTSLVLPETKRLKLLMSRFLNKNKNSYDISQDNTISTNTLYCAALSFAVDKAISEVNNFRSIEADPKTNTRKLTYIKRQTLALCHGYIMKVADYIRQEGIIFLNSIHSLYNIPMVINMYTDGVKLLADKAGTSILYTTEKSVVKKVNGMLNGSLDNTKEDLYNTLFAVNLDTGEYSIH